MATVIGLDLATHSIGWAIVDTSSNQVETGMKIFAEALPADRPAQRRIYRNRRRRTRRFGQRLLFNIRQQYPALLYQPGFTSKIKKVFPILIHGLLATLFISSLLLAIFNKKEFQFWFNLSITTLLAWITLKK